MKYAKDEQKRLSDLSRSFLKNTTDQNDYAGLIEVLVFHEWRYYVQNDPILSDFEYDQLFDALKDIETNHPSIIRPDSPSQRVASDLKADFFTVPHLTPMLSLGNSYNSDDLLDFNKSVYKNTNKAEGESVAYAVEPKFDGGSIALVYENDLLVRAATRGNGVEGEEMTANAKAMSSIPLQASFSSLGIYKAELRGEAIIRKDIFDRANQKRAAEGKTLFANPRNAATGGLRTKDSNETRARGIQTFVFQMGYAVDKEGNDMLPTLGTQSKTIVALSRLGFKTAGEAQKSCASIEEVITFCSDWEAKRESYPYEIDGMVVKVDDFKLQEQMGYTQHHPKWAIAYKFAAKQATTKLIGVDFQVGKVGSITPVAKLEPVPLAGVTISSVSLHNEDFIKERDLKIGDTVLVERAGDVIPYIVKAMEDLRDGSETAIDFPKICPAHPEDNVSLLREEGEAAWRCPDFNCPAQRLQRIIFHVSKEAMDIDGFGKSNVEKFFELGWLNDIADVYDLDYEKIKALDGFGDKSVDKLKEAIEKAKSNPISKLLHSLSIHHLGKKAGKILAAEVDHVMAFKDWPIERYTEVKDIGPVLAKNMYDHFHDENHLALLLRLESLGVNFSQTEEDKPAQVSEDAPLAGKTILFTGTLEQMGRKEAQKLAEKAGAKNISAVSSNLDILVVGAKAGSKLKKAEAIGSVAIMTEADFIALINA